MINKLISGLIVLFWVVMTSWLVRLEYFPAKRNVVPTRDVLDLVFADKQQQRQNFIVFFQGREMGVMDLDIDPRLDFDRRHTPRNLTRYVVATASHMDLKKFGHNVRLMLTTHNRLTADYEIESYDVTGRIGSDVLRVNGSTTNDQVNVEYRFGGRRGRYTIDLKDQNSDSLNGLLAQAGMPQLGLLSSVLGLALNPATQPGSFKPATTGYTSQLVIQGVKQPMFVIESKAGDHLWAKLWISRAGEIILFETSAELVLKNSMLFPAEDTDILRLRPPPIPVRGATRDQD